MSSVFTKYIIYYQCDKLLLYGVKFRISPFLLKVEKKACAAPYKSISGEILMLNSDSVETLMILTHLRSQHLSGFFNYKRYIVPGSATPPIVLLCVGVNIPARKIVMSIKPTNSLMLGKIRVPLLARQTGGYTPLMVAILALQMLPRTIIWAIRYFKKLEFSKYEIQHEQSASIPGCMRCIFLF